METVTADERSRAQIIGERIRSLRVEHGVSMRELARRLVRILGIEGEKGQETMRRYLKRWEPGADGIVDHLPSEHFRNAICDALGVPRDELRLEDDAEPSSVRVVIDLPTVLLDRLVAVKVTAEVERQLQELEVAR